MRPNVFILFVTAFLGFFISQAKGQIWISNNDLYGEAGDFLNAEDYEEALPLYLLLEKKDIATANIKYKIGTCYLNIRGKKDKAIPYLESAVQFVSSKYEDKLTEARAPLKALLMLGVAYRMNNEPERAIETFNILKDSIGESNSDLLTLVDLHIKRCENAIILGAFPGKAVKEKLPVQINSEFSNYNPILVDHEKVLYYMEKLKFYDAVMRSRFDNGEWSTPENITPEIGSEGDDYLVGSSADGSKLFFYYYETLKAGEIYTIEKTHDGWSKLKLLNENINTKYNETNASPSADGKTLFFTSNRPGGFGGLDIYMSKLDLNNDWGPAVNLGPSVNTPYNEECPFISSNDSILYFSSQGHMNMGGYDVFYSKRKGENGWSQPVNMGSPVSTTDDDFFYYPVGNGLSGMMSRIEGPASTSYDIYRYKNIEFPNTPRFEIKGDVAGVTDQNYKTITVAVIDAKTSQTIQTTSPDANGNYKLMLPEGDFKIVVKDGLGSENSTSISTENAISETMVLPQQMLTEKITPIAKIQKQDSVFLKNVLFRFNDSTIQPQYLPYLDSIKQVLLKYPSLNFKIIGYADALGDENFNLVLSRKRAVKIAEYIDSQYANNKRLLIIGKGESDPAAINANSDGSDNPAGRKYNRRVMFVPDQDLKNVIFINVSNVPIELRQKEK
jgi:outer membrane protein OmpA-like peptidoglycan-associated protein/tetratricopeptide (TPR) repeat protein